MITCGQTKRGGKVCGKPAVAVLLIGQPATPLGACRDDLTPLVLEYLGTRGAVDVVRPDVVQ